MKTLSVGKHTLKVAFSDGKEALTKFEIKEKQQTVNIENNEKNSNVQKENSSVNPKTGDNVILYFILSAISIVGIVTLVVINVKKRKLGGKKSEN